MTDLSITSSPYLSDYRKATLLMAWMAKQPDDLDPAPKLAELDQIGNDPEASERLWQTHIASVAWPDSVEPISGCCDRADQA